MTGRVLVVMSTILILLATVHVGVSLQQLLDAFVYVPPDVADYSTIYWLYDDLGTTLKALKPDIFGVLVCNTCALVCQSYAEGNNGGIHARLYYSKFSMATIM